MENLETTQPAQAIEQDGSKKNSGPLIIFIVTFLLVVIALWQFSGGKIDKRPMDANELVKQAPKEKAIEQAALPLTKSEDITPVEVEQIERVVEDEVIVDKPVTILPTLDESDSLMQGKLPDLTWRNELLSLIITEDIIRRFVVFTDNFAQGLLAYEHSPFTSPNVRFSGDEELLAAENKQNVWQWDPETSKRFDLYVDLLRSVDSATLVNWYFEIKPLIDEAYSELGYEEDFTYTLQDAITRVLDMELPKSSMALTRTSVMYKFQDPQLEALDDSDKLLLRIGKENLLIIKSVLLDVNEKINKQIDAKS